MWISRFSNTSSLIPSRLARLRTTVRAASTDSFITYALSYKYKRRYLRDFGFQIHEFKPFPEDAPIDVDATGAVIKGVPLVSLAFAQNFHEAAGWFVTIAVLLFAFTTVLGWSFYGSKALEYLLGTKAVVVYKIIFVAFVVIGATMDLSLAWDISDTLNGLMAIPNLIGVLTLSGTVIAITKNFLRRREGQALSPMLSAYPEVQKAQEEAMRQETVE